MIRVRENKTIGVTHDVIFDGFLDFVIRKFKARASGRGEGLSRKLHKGHTTNANVELVQTNRH